jgi:glucan 1,4-alpha-glucosidase
MKRNMFRHWAQTMVACAAVYVSQASLHAQGEAPGVPGAALNWETGNKQGLGTATSTDSKVWYTLSNGVLSEVYYPSGDTANVRSLEFAVTDGATFVDRESDNTTQQIQLVDNNSLIYRQINTAKSGRYQIIKTYVTDPKRATVLIHVRFRPLASGTYRLFVLYDPTIGNSGLNNTGSRDGSGNNVALLAKNTPVTASSALVSSSGFLHTSSGFIGVSDGWTDLQAHHQLIWSYDTATNGNVMQAGEIPLNGGSDCLLSPNKDFDADIPHPNSFGRETAFTLSLGFGTTAADAENTARSSLKLPFLVQAVAYDLGWRFYLASLKPAPQALSAQLRKQYNVSLMTIKSHEDKTFIGAFIASLTLPWGFSVSDDNQGASYHFVWARDMYEQVTGLLAAGDREGANNAVTWLFTHQQLPDGTFPQNSKVDGTPSQTNLQMDEVSFPIILAWQMNRTDDATWNGVSKAANAIVANGPTTPQERWEETGGYSPSTIAAEIAGLTTAADIARLRGDSAHSLFWTGVADAWQRSTEKWMFTTTGDVGDGHYYVRINANGTPDDGATRNYANGAGVHKENSVLDGGFLELVRLGLKAPNDPYVATSISKLDTSISTVTPSGEVWHRYTFDGYGEEPDGSPWSLNGTDTIGRCWPLLTGERGEYVVAGGGNGLSYLQTLANTANDGGMIPEQVWDQPDPAPAPYGYLSGKSTGSACPLSWATSGYVRLALSIQDHKLVETPAVVAQRYASGAHFSVPTLTVTAPLDSSLATQSSVAVTGTTNGQLVLVGIAGTIYTATPKNGAFNVTVPLALGGNLITVVARAADGGTNMSQVTVADFGTRLGGFTDSAGDDNGPGSYVYPTNSAYVPGAFDLTKLDVFINGTQAFFVAKIAGQVTNPFGGDHISLQHLNVYLGRSNGNPVPALPGTNLNVATAWSVAIVGDGRFSAAGAYAPDGTKLASATLITVPQTHQIAVGIPLSALNGLDLTTAYYGTAMFDNCQSNEGIGFVRPVYSLAFWSNPGPGLSFIPQFFFGGGAGQATFNGANDTDTSDPNAIDIIVGPGQSQSEVLNWQLHSPCVLPMLPLGR